MPTTPSRPRSFLRRALAPSRRLASVKRVAHAARLAGSMVRSRAPGDAIRLVEGTLRDAADMVATRILSLDDDASALAFFVEANRGGRDVGDLMGTMLRRNLLLDGTFMSLVEPLVTRSELPDALDDTTLDRAAETVTCLLVELAGLEVADDGGHEARLDALRRHATPPAGNVLAHLAGHSSAEDRTRFVALSYVLFLESWLLRATVDRMGSLARMAGSPPTLDPTPDSQ